MKRIFLIFFLSFFGFSIYSQEGYRSGYVITYQKDTIRGKIKDRKFYNNKINWQKINFIRNNGEKDKYTADDIWGYTKNGTATFRSLALGVEGVKRFAEIIESGDVILFAYLLGRSEKAPPDYYLQKANDVNSLMEWREADYKKTAAYFFKGDTALIRSIENEKLKHGDIQTIVREYNIWKIRQ